MLPEKAFEKAIQWKPSGEPDVGRTADSRTEEKRARMPGPEINEKSGAGEVTPLPETREAAPPAQAKSAPEPDNPKVFPAPAPTSAQAIERTSVPVKGVMPEPDRIPVPDEPTTPVEESKAAYETSLDKTGGKSDATSAPAGINTSSLDPVREPTGQPHQAGKQTGPGQENKGKQAGALDYDPGGHTAGIETSYQLGETGGAFRNSGPSGDDETGNRGTATVSGTSTGSVRGHQLRASSLSNQNMAGTSEIRGKGEEPSSAIRVPEVLLSGDIKIEVIGEGKVLSDISLGLSIREHPAKRKKYKKDQGKKVEEAEIKNGRGNSDAAETRTLMVRKAEKGVYILSLATTGEASSVAVVFSLYPVSEKSRIKEYKSLALTSAAVTKIIFLMPEALFWDDTDRFSGSIEDSHSVTKFRHESGLLWREEKE